MKEKDVKGLKRLLKRIERYITKNSKTEGICSMVLCNTDNEKMIKKYERELESYGIMDFIKYTRPNKDDCTYFKVKDALFDGALCCYNERGDICLIYASIEPLEIESILERYENE